MARAALGARPIARNESARAAFARTATTPTASDPAAAPSAAVASESAFAHKGYTRAANDALTLDELKRATVYDRDDDSIGEVSDMLVSADGKIADAVVNVGGFLGMGAHTVSLKLDDLTVLREDGGDAVRIYADATKEQLKAVPTHQK